MMARAKDHGHAAGETDDEDDFDSGWPVNSTSTSDCLSFQSRSCSNLHRIGSRGRRRRMLTRIASLGR